MQLIDHYNRVHNYLRFSITKNCNLSCLYCNPNKKINSKKEALSSNEILNIIELFFLLGIKKLRLTGGEPLLRDDFDDLVKNIHTINKKYNAELAITTNGILLDKKADILNDYGFHNINLSLDSLDVIKFEQITGNNKLEKTLKSIDILKSYSNFKIKLNTVIIKGKNDNEIMDFVEFSIKYNIPVRFIEFMPFSKNEWSIANFISYKEIIEIISKKYNLLKIDNGSNLAKYYNIAGTNSKIGFITSISEHFCSYCNRLRITNDGKLKLCLFSNQNNLLDLRNIIYNYTQEEAKFIINSFLKNKDIEHPDIKELLSLKSNDMLQIGG